MFLKYHSIFVCCILLLRVPNDAASPVAQPYGNITNKTSDKVHISINGEEHKLTKSIQTEAGPIQVFNDSDKTKENTLKKPTLNHQVSTSATVNVTSNTTVFNHHGRENVVLKSDESSVRNESTMVPTSTMSTSHPVVANEKVIPVSEASVPSTTTRTTTTRTTTQITKKLNVSSATLKTVNATEEIIEAVGDSKIKPRKGAPPLEITNSTTVKSTSNKPVKKKPTVTVGSDDEPYLPSSFLTHQNLGKHTNVNSSAPKVQQAPIDIVSVRHYKKGPDYVLPITMTILAVPLVAIIAAVLYKRGAEWWHHRHYRRMDFLIDGIYNN